MAAFVETLHEDDEVTAATVTEFEKWRTDGFPIPDDLDEQRARYFTRIRTAATAPAVYAQARLATDPDPWVRLGLAVNPDANPVVLWGDGERSFGLAEDPNPWVRSATWYRLPAPPPHLKALLDQKEQATPAA